MKENEVAALIRGLAPGIRQVVSDAVTARLAEVPPDLAEQVALAVRMLHESPPLKQQEPSNS